MPGFRWALSVSIDHAYFDNTIASMLLRESRCPGELSMQKTRLAVIGCGAVARISHLPAIRDSEFGTAEALVDLNLSRAKELAQKYDVRISAEDYRDIVDKVDGAIVALPNHLHAPVATDLLRRGIHTLVEKPMALSCHECDQMLQAARSSGAVLAIGLEFRFFDS